MDKQEFYDQQKEEIKKRYSSLRKEKDKKTRDESLEIMAKEFGYSKSTLKEIMSNSSYRKSTNKSA